MFCYRDVRFSKESNAYSKFLRFDFPPPNDFTIDSVRQRSELLHEKINEKLIGTFKGHQEERQILLTDTTRK